MQVDDYNVAGGAGRGGAAVREDINAILLAIATQNSFATAPPVTYPFMPWMDTSVAEPVFKMRNAANSAWVLARDLIHGDGMTTLQALSLGAPVVKTANFTVAANENWLVNNKAGSACVVTLPSAAAFVGRQIMFQNRQAQSVVSASANVVPLAGGAAATAILPAIIGASVTLVSDGANWIQTALTAASDLGAMTLLGTIATTSGTVATLAGLNLAGYRHLLARFQRVSKAASTTFTINGGQISSTYGAAVLASGDVVVDLTAGDGYAMIGQTTGAASLAPFTVVSGWNNATTSISITTGSGATLNGGAIQVFGVK